MNDLQVECFLAIVKHMSFSKAAQEKYISQPSMSKHIRNLENSLGFVLFNRLNNKLRLTPAGELFYNFFLEYKEAFEAVEKQAKLLRGQSDGRVRIAFLSSFKFGHNIMNIFNNCIETHPEIDVEVYHFGFHNIEKALLEDEVDVILHLKDFIPSIPNIIERKLCEIPKVIVFRDDILPVSDKARTPEDFENQTFLVLQNKANPYVGPKVIEYLSTYGFSPKIKYVPNVECMIWGVKRGEGVAVMDTWVQWDNDYPVSTVSLDPPHIVVLAYKKNNANRAASTFINELLFAVREYNEEEMSFASLGGGYNL